jgi:hypothetical protein
MALNLTQIKNLWTVIRNATQNAENTATRVGQAGIEIADYLATIPSVGFTVGNLVGVINAHIRPNSTSGKISYLTWHSDESTWQWTIYNTSTNTLIDQITIPIETKVFNRETNSIIPGLQANRIYILKANGQVLLDSGSSGEATMPIPFSAIPRVFTTQSSGLPFRGEVRYSSIGQPGQPAGWRYVILEGSGGNNIMYSVMIADDTIVGMDRGDDGGYDSMIYYRCKSDGSLQEVTLGGGGSGGDITGDDIDNLVWFLMERMVGVPKVQYINPTQSQEQTSISYAKWVTDKWWWNTKNSITGETAAVPLALGTKVNMNGVYYTLKSGNQYSEDLSKLDILQNHVGILSVGAINPLLSTDTDIYVKWEEKFGTYRWVYHVGDGNAFTISMNSLVKKPNGLISKYYRLNDDGTATEDIAPEQYVGKARPLSGINFVKQSDSLIAEPPTDLVVNLDGLVGIFENNGIKSIFLRCNNVEIQSSSQGLGYAGFVGQVEYFMDDNDTWRMHIVGITEDKNKNEFYFAE